MKMKTFDAILKLFFIANSMLLILCHRGQPKNGATGKQGVGSSRPQSLMFGQSSGSQINVGTASPQQGVVQQQQEEKLEIQIGMHYQEDGKIVQILKKYLDWELDQKIPLVTVLMNVYQINAEYIGRGMIRVEEMNREWKEYTIKEYIKTKMGAFRVNWLMPGDTQNGQQIYMPFFGDESPKVFVHLMGSNNAIQYQVHYSTSEDDQIILYNRNRRGNAFLIRNGQLRQDSFQASPAPEELGTGYYERMDFRAPRPLYTSKSMGLDQVISACKSTWRKIKSAPLQDINYAMALVFLMAPFNLLELVKLENWPTNIQQDPRSHHVFNLVKQQLQFRDTGSQIRPSVRSLSLLEDPQDTFNAPGMTAGQPPTQLQLFPTGSNQHASMETRPSLDAMVHSLAASLEMDNDNQIRREDYSILESNPHPSASSYSSSIFAPIAHPHQHHSLTPSLLSLQQPGVNLASSHGSASARVPSLLNDQNREMPSTVGSRRRQLATSLVDSENAQNSPTFGESSRKNMEE